MNNAVVELPPGAVISACPSCGARCERDAGRLCIPNGDSCVVEDRGYKFAADVEAEGRA
jgi:hypothetical protein